MKETLKEIPLIIFLLIIGIPLFILFIPLIIVFLVFEFFQKKRFKNRYQNYLLSIEGKNSSVIILEKTIIIISKKTLLGNLLKRLNMSFWKEGI